MKHFSLINNAWCVVVVWTENLLKDSFAVMGGEGEGRMSWVGGGQEHQRTSVKFADNERASDSDDESVRTLHTLFLFIYFIN